MRRRLSTGLLTSWGRSFRRPKRHACTPPSGVVFDELWSCPDCAAVWQLIERAPYSEWVLVGWPP